MERWSPRTLVRYGFCREDEAGNIVSVWNWGELEEVLNGIESSEDEEVLTSQLSLRRTSSTKSELKGLVPRDIAGDSSFIAVNCLGCRGSDSRCKGGCSRQRQGFLHLQCCDSPGHAATILLEECHHEYVRNLSCSDMRETSAE
ncbi:hypothetical protein M758_UG306100 [Ceratodon purpureus]|nr:hypothetical protein M758_UG306100 [Ceratodon purpureus]